MLRVQRYPRGPPLPGVWYATESRDAAVDVARAASLVDAARGCSAVVCAPDNVLAPLLQAAFGVVLQLGEWRYAGKIAVFRVRQYADMDAAFAPASRDAATFSLGTAAQMHVLGVARALTLRVDNYPVHFAVPRNASVEQYYRVVDTVLFAGRAGVEDKRVNGKGALALALPQPASHAAGVWMRVLSSIKGSTIVVGPAFFLIDAHRFILSQTDPRYADVQAANHARAAWSDAVILPSPPLLMPRRERALKRVLE